VLTLVRRARRRLLCNELLSQGVNASSAALMAFVLLLLVGTEVLNWQWALVIPVVAAVAGVYVARRRLPPPYTVAQVVDHRMRLADTLSTALFFSQGEPPPCVSREVRQSQFEQAARLAQTVDVRRAVPYTVPRTVYLLAALVLVASSLFALRYGLSRRLDLKPPPARILQETLGGHEPTRQAGNVHRKAPWNPDSPDARTASFSDPDQQSRGQLDATSDNVPDASSDPIQDRGAAASPNGASRKQAEAVEKVSDDGLELQDADAPDADGDDARSGKPGGKSSQNQQAAAQQGSNNSSESSSLLTKIKDAMQNLLSSLKPPQSFPGGRQQSETGAPGKGQQSGGKQPSAKDGRQQNGGQQGDSQEGQPSEEARNLQDSAGKGTGTRDTQQASKQPGSGIGSQDGDKNLRQAEQLAAMGKISEIIGKRSANITGEVTVEVRSTSQQLRTPYAQRGAQHSQGGAEIDRDEIPVALESYVERYFEQVRKSAPPGK